MKKYLLRLALFLAIYTFLAKYHDVIFGKIYGYTINKAVPIYYMMPYPLLIIFSFVRKERISKFKKWKEKVGTRILLLLIAGAFLAAPTPFVHKLLGNPALSYYSTYYLGSIMLLPVIFGIKFIREFKDEAYAVVMVLINILLINILLAKYWFIFSFIISGALKYTLPLIDKSANVNMSTFDVSMKGFVVNISAACAGIYSLVTFASLYLVALYLMSKIPKVKINKKKSVLALIVGLIAIFTLNIIRVGTIITVGALYSPELALNLFHEYMGSIILLIALMIYLYFVIPRVIERK